MSDMKREDASAPVDAADTQAVTATPETPATPETGTPSFADACERAALAVGSILEGKCIGCSRLTPHAQTHERIATQVIDLAAHLAGIFHRGEHLGSSREVPRTVRRTGLIE